ncbi:permease prefix domain 1-containing protein (plasmid) [Deinococcus sp. KNUC1210]|uniref:permease prefix domain 1-containing protein n=1 Tax=Deinococcus sp. KNUC1210 TaxID=2917691 RepID=UPI001EF0FE8A|nr:permease prefix domain 1-containing protein [Deinococcus sp. KNUC1210]ULH17310.1 permease prefix domain 1-containing protein [Deinococcus sp. KNUC1210]
MNRQEEPEQRNANQGNERRSADELSQYLRQSARGLYGRRRRELQAELRGHVEARCRELSLLGLTRAEAVRRALQELGAPAHVSTGMASVYLLPGIARAAALSALLGAALLGVGTYFPGLAQVQGYQTAFTLPGPFTYIDVSSLKAELQRSGGTLGGTPTRPVLHLPGLTTPIPVDTGNDPYLRRVLLRDYPSGQTYLDLNTLVTATLRAGLRPQVSGWERPALHLNGTTLALGTPDHPVDPYSLYSLGLTPLLSQLGLTSAQSARWMITTLSSRHTLTLSAPAPSGVYALVSVLQLTSALTSRQQRGPVLAFDLAQPDAEGRLRFSMPYSLSSLRLGTDPQALKTDLNHLTEADYASARRPAHALLLRLSGELSPHSTPYSVVPRHDLSNEE